MSIAVIESTWIETTMQCPNCHGPMYSDGISLPVCGNDDCLHQATMFDVLQWLITEHGDNELTQVARTSRALLIHIQSDGDYRLTAKTFNRGAEAQGLLDDLQAALDALDKEK